MFLSANFSPGLTRIEREIGWVTLGWIYKPTSNHTELLFIFLVFNFCFAMQTMLCKIWLVLLAMEFFSEIKIF